MDSHNTPGAVVARGALAIATLWSGVGLLAALWAILAPRSVAIWFEGAPDARWAVALPFAITSYLLRFVRWHLLARRIVPGLLLGRSFAVEAAGFGLTATPARLGELAKCYLLERQTAVPAARSAPILLVEKLSEGAGFSLLALGAGLLLAPSDAFRAGHLWPLLVLAVAVLAALGLRAGRLRARLARLPLVAVLRQRLGGVLGQFVDGSWRVLGPRPLAEAVGVSVVARSCDAVVLYLVATSLGVALSPVAAAFVLGTAGLVGGFSMLPAGMGAVEASMVALLVAFGAPATVALGATLVTRGLILWLWVAFGLVVVVATPALWRRA